MNNNYPKNRDGIPSSRVQSIDFTRQTPVSFTQSYNAQARKDKKKDDLMTTAICLGAILLTSGGMALGFMVGRSYERDDDTPRRALPVCRPYNR